MERNPALLLEGMALAGLRGRRRARLRLRALGVPALGRGAARGRTRRRSRPATSATTSAAAASASTSRIVEGAGSYVVGEETALLNSLDGPARHRLGAAAVPRRARLRRAADRRQQRRDARATSRSSPSTEPTPTRRSAPARPPAPSSSASTSASATRRAIEVPFGITMREICEDLGGGLVDGHEIKALQIGGPLGGILPGSRARHAASTSTSSPPRAAWSATAGSSPSTSAPTCARWRATCCDFGAAESCGKCFPCRIGLAARARDGRAPTRRSTASALEELLETLEVGEPLRARRRHAGADPQPDRPLARGAGGRLMEVFVDGRAVEVEPGTTVLEAAPRPAATSPTLCFDDRVSRVRRLPRLPGRDRGRAGPGAARARRPCRDGMRIATDDETARRESPRTSSSWCSRSFPARPRRTPSWPRSPPNSGSARRAGPAPRTTPDHDGRHPYLVLQHELCISCGRCVRACDEVQGAFALTATGRGFDSQRHRRARLWLRASRPASPAGRARTPVRRTRSPSICSSSWRESTGGEELAR